MACWPTGRCISSAKRSRQGIRPALPPQAGRAPLGFGALWVAKRVATLWRGSSRREHDFLTTEQQLLPVRRAKSNREIDANVRVSLVLRSALCQGGNEGGASSRLRMRVAELVRVRKLRKPHDFRYPKIRP